LAKFSETSDAKKGGLFVGDSHAEGGIPAIVTDTGQPIEVEGGEAIINKKATALHWKELSKINQSAGGGVPIPPPDDADKVLEKYSQGGTITNKEKKIVFDKWKKLVNMTFTELSRYYHSKEGKESGLTESEAKEQGISSGRESAEWILKMKKTNWKKWTDDMWKWANKQISFISRMSGIQGDLIDEKGKKTRKYKALLIWGNNPKKKNAYQFKTGGGIPETSNSETTYYIQKRISKYEDITYVIMERYPYLTGFAVEEYNGEVYTDELEAKSKLNYIILINKKYKTGGELLKRKDGSYSERGLWDNIRENAGSGKKPTPEMLEQESIIKQKYHLGGDMSKHLAPNGKPSNLTHDQWHLVRTPEFKKWFGDWENSPETASKVVDSNGEPLVLYHGTDVEFNEFDLSKIVLLVKKGI